MILRFLTIFSFLIYFVFSNIWAAEEPEKDVRIKSRGSLSYNKRDAKTKVYIEGVTLDMDYMRRNMRFADFVNDPAVADVHIIINSRRSGSGGTVYSLMYNNLTFANFNDFTITCTTIGDDTNEEERKKLKDALSLGLMPFVNQTKASDQLSLRYRGEKETITANEVEDPWHNWTFRGDVNGRLNLEESKTNFDYAFNARADKVTDDIRIRNNARRSVKTKRYTSNGEVYRSDNTSSYASSSAVKSLSSRWSTGVFGSFYNSNYRNTKYAMSFKPAIEYNIFPWDESDRKVFTIAYYFGPEWMKYYEESIYNKMNESLWEQSLRLNLQIVETWGEIEAGLNATNYMHDWTKNRIVFDTNLSVRIIRGLSVQMGFRVENVHDQIYLPKGNISLEDILMNKVQLPSSFEVGADVGVRVQFGSIYNNIVNNRL